MLSLFASNQLFNQIALFVIAILLSVFSFVYPIEPLIIGAGPLSELLYTYLNPIGIGSKILFFFILFFQAFFLNQIVANFKISYEHTAVPGLVYVLLLGFHPQFHYLSPFILANSFALLAIYNLLATFRAKAPAHHIFNCGFYAATAVLCCPYFFFIIIGSWLGLNTLLNFKFRDLVVYLSGIFVPYFLWWTIIFWQDKADYFFYTIWIKFTGFFKPSGFEFISDYILLGIFLLFCLIAIISFGLYTSRQSFQAQKNVRVLYFMYLLGLISLLFNDHLKIQNFQSLALMLGMFLAFNLLYTKKQLLKELLFIAFLFAVFYFQYYYLKH